MTGANVSFGVIPPEDWLQPDWIDEERAKAGRDELVRQNIVYGGESLRWDASCAPLKLRPFNR